MIHGFKSRICYQLVEITSKHFFFLNGYICTKQTDKIYYNRRHYPVTILGFNAHCMRPTR